MVYCCNNSQYNSRFLLAMICGLWFEGWALYFILHKNLLWYIWQTTFDNFALILIWQLFIFWKVFSYYENQYYIVVLMCKSIFSSVFRVFASLLKYIMKSVFRLKWNKHKSTKFIENLIKNSVHCSDCTTRQFYECYKMCLKYFSTAN